MPGQYRGSTILQHDPGAVVIIEPGYDRNLQACRGAEVT